MMRKYESFSATVTFPSNLKPEDIPAFRCPKCGGRMVAAIVDVNHGIRQGRDFPIPGDVNVRRITTGTMWECELCCDEKVLFRKIQEG